MRGARGKGVILDSRCQARPRSENREPGTKNPHFAFPHRRLVLLWIFAPMKRPLVSTPLLAGMALLAGLCLSATSCSKLKELLPKPAPKDALVKPLTEEEEKLEKSLDAQEVFSA